jgi:hypothetical protein
MELPMSLLFTSQCYVLVNSKITTKSFTVDSLATRRHFFFFFLYFFFFFFFFLSLFFFWVWLESCTLTHKLGSLPDYGVNLTNSRPPFHRGIDTTLADKADHTFSI